VLVKSRTFFDTLPSLTQGGAAADAQSPLHGAGGGSSGRSNSSELPLLGDEFGLVDDRMANQQGRGPAAGDRGDMRFNAMTGILVEADRARFERALFRATRGNCYVRFAPIDTLMPAADNSGALVAKTVFIIFYKSASIEAKARRLCDAFGARRYSVPDAGGVEGGQAVDAAVESNRQDIADARAVLIKNREVRCKEGKGKSGRGRKRRFMVCERR
jgi:vacuolar-type H+-ATPase subunit I/STV1